MAADVGADVDDCWVLWKKGIDDAQLDRLVGPGGGSDSVADVICDVHFQGHVPALRKPLRDDVAVLVELRGGASGCVIVIVDTD